MNKKSEKEKLTFIQNMSNLIDEASNFFAHRKGLLPMLGMLLIIVNFLLASFLPGEAYLVRSNLALHLGLLVAIFGFMLAWAL